LQWSAIAMDAANPGVLSIGANGPLTLGGAITSADGTAVSIYAGNTGSLLFSRIDTGGTGRVFIENPGSIEQSQAAAGGGGIRAGTVLLSNEGRAMMTIVASAVEYHDTIGGACSCESNTLRYGHHTKAQHACVENFLEANLTEGRGKRDIVANINFFMNVPVESDGALGIVDGISAPGLTVDLKRGRGSCTSISGKAGFLVESEGSSLEVEENAGDVARGGTLHGEEVEGVVARKHDPAARRVIGRVIGHAALSPRLRLPAGLPVGGQEKHRGLRGQEKGCLARPTPGVAGYGSVGILLQLLFSP
jgi:hypothetical protein